MLLIWGTRSTIAQLATLLLTCGACRTPAAHHVKRLRRWFTLFFIPVIPFKSLYFTTCTYCGIDLKLTPEEAARLEEAAKGPVSPPERQLPALAAPPQHPGAQAPAGQYQSGPQPRGGYQQHPAAQGPTGPQHPYPGAQAPAGYQPQGGYQQHPGAQGAPHGQPQPWQQPQGGYQQHPGAQGAPHVHQGHHPGLAHQPPQAYQQQPSGQGWPPAQERLGEWRG